MSHAVAKVAPPNQRHTTDESHPLDDAWVSEIQRRRQLTDEGLMPLHPWAEIRVELLQKKP